MTTCARCGLAYDWTRRATVTGTPAPEARRLQPPETDPPEGLRVEPMGDVLVMLLPTTRAMGFAVLLVLALAIPTFTLLFFHGSDQPRSWLEWAVFVTLFPIMFVMTGVIGVRLAFTRRRITVTRDELRVDSVPFGGTHAVVPVRELQQLGVARTRRGRKQIVDDHEVIAITERADLRILITRDAALATYIERRLEYHLGITDDGSEFVSAP